MSEMVEQARAPIQWSGGEQPVPYGTLVVPLAKDHWIAVSSNKPLTIEHFRQLHQHLALQRETLTEDHPTGDDR